MVLADPGIGVLEAPEKKHQGEEGKSPERCVAPPFIYGRSEGHPPGGDETGDGQWERERVFLPAIEASERGPGGFHSA